jgi:hypothetical protein
MKIRNLLLLAITIAIATLSAQAQERDGSMTFTDHLGQSITISSFGTVLSFKDSKGRENETENYFRIGPYGNIGPWIDSRKADGTSTSLKAKFPQPGATLEKGQAMDVTATVRQGGLIVTRRLTWPAGSGEVNIDETIFASSAIVVGTLEEGILGNLKFGPTCPAPPQCPPDTASAFALKSQQLPISPGKPSGILFTTELTRQLPISPGKPIRVQFTTELAKIPPISPGNRIPPISPGSKIPPISPGRPAKRPPFTLH